MYSIVALAILFQQAVAAAVPASLQSPNTARADYALRSFTYGGTGCPQGSIDADAYSFKYPNLKASVSPSGSVLDQRRNCQVNIDLTYGDGVQFRLAPNRAFTRRLRIKLDSGASATYKTAYYFSGSASQAVVQYTWNGPLDTTVSVSDPPSDIASIWSPCGTEAMLNINRQVRTTGTTGTIQYVETAEDNIPWDAFEWREC